MSTKKEKKKYPIRCISTPDPKIWDKIEKIAKEQGDSVSSVVQFILGKYLEERIEPYETDE